MGILKKIFTNCAHPKGQTGRIMLSMMNFSHAPLTNWGLNLINFQEGWTILDIGCGGGATIKRLLKHSKGAKVYGIDISQESVAKTKKTCADILDKQVFVSQGSAEMLPYETGKFDLVTAVETIYFWPNLPGCFKEVYRVLKPGGRFAVIVEDANKDSVWTNIVEGMTTYSTEQLLTMLQKAGFSQVESHSKKPMYHFITGIKA
ncbi:MAG: class I SAM-dependent methyltransferase [Endomicrobiaceae bacterium]|nr:class I SAM-dependent methyltransferase [Endomicrobiaceae bacterium]